MNKAPIGIFDSGVGGTSIWKEIHELMPHENTLYLADSKNAPYGEKPKKKILELSIKNTEYLIAAGCKIVVVACNTATTNAISELRKRYSIPFIGIEPAIKPAALKTQSKVVGILATKGTMTSELFHQTSKPFTNEIEMIEVIGKGLVPYIEAGALEDPQLQDLLKSYLQPMLDANVDYIVLGCSHYPYLIPQIEKLIPPHIRIIDSGAAVARQTKAVLEQHQLLNNVDGVPLLKFYTNTHTATLDLLLKDYEKDISVVKKEF